MNTKVKLVVWVLVVILVLWAGVTFPKGNPVIQQVVGSVTGPSLLSPFWEVNGVANYYYTSQFNNASTTLCSFQSPSATSTLRFAGVQISTGTSTAIVIDIGKGAATNNTATTTLLIPASYTPVASAQDTFNASSTNGLNSASVFSPNNYLVVKFGAATAITATTNSLKGTCKAIFTVN